jgi:hypothetical protein
MLRFDAEESLVARPARAPAEADLPRPAYDDERLVRSIPYVPLIAGAMLGTAYVIWATVL